MLVDILSVSARALGFVALFQAAGIVVFLALHEQQLPATRPLLRRLGIAAALVAVVLLMAEFLLEPARMRGELSGALDPALRRILIHSATGVALSWQMLGLLLMIIALRVGRAAGTVAGVVGVVVLLAAFTFVGHTSSSGARWVLSPVLLLHLWVVTFWFGALLPLYLMSSRESAATSAHVVAQFSAQAIGLVPLLLLAGATLAAGLLPGLAAFRTSYGELLMVKLGGFCALLLLAASNRWRWGPALRTGQPQAGRRFRYALTAEYLLIVGVLCVTAVMTSFYSPES
ncbi:MAG TPA: CopD family protein [Steroidobacteraceae bacterium]|nr:CopD family protein [Steroidobacteraceae bacterium]